MRHEDDLVWVEDEEMQTTVGWPTYGIHDLSWRVREDPSGGKVLRIQIGASGVVLQMTAEEWVFIVEQVRVRTWHRLAASRPTPCLYP